jgi:DNA-binding CsgD family transcriptional regulator
MRWQRARRCITATSPSPRPPRAGRSPAAAAHLRHAPPRRPDPPRARARLHCARRRGRRPDPAAPGQGILEQRPHLGILPTQADQLQSKLDSLRETTASAATLTTAELRLLPLLLTHLTFREISERLYLSPHTVKSQAISFYRKLGVSSRKQAIQRMQQAGLLGP